MSILDIKEEIKKNKPVLGTKQIIKMLMNNQLKKIYLSSNCSEKDKIINLANISNVEVLTLPESSKQIGATCKKTFPVSALGFQ